MQKLEESSTDVLHLLPFSLNSQNRRLREFTPEDQKDQIYWAKRRKNNEAAKRSREKRRLNCLILSHQVLRLASENKKLKMELIRIRKKLSLAIEKGGIDVEEENDQVDIEEIEDSEIGVVDFNGNPKNFNEVLAMTKKLCSKISLENAKEFSKKPNSYSQSSTHITKETKKKENDFGAGNEINNFKNTTSKPFKISKTEENDSKEKNRNKVSCSLEKRETKENKMIEKSSNFSFNEKLMKQNTNECCNFPKKPTSDQNITSLSSSSVLAGLSVESLTLSMNSNMDISDSHDASSKDQSSDYDKNNNKSEMNKSLNNSVNLEIFENTFLEAHQNKCNTEFSKKSSNKCFMPRLSMPYETPFPFQPHPNLASCFPLNYSNFNTSFVYTPFANTTPTYVDSIQEKVKPTPNFETINKNELNLFKVKGLYPTFQPHIRFPLKSSCSNSVPKPLFSFSSMYLTPIKTDKDRKLEEYPINLSMKKESENHINYENNLREISRKMFINSSRDYFENVFSIPNIEHHTEVFPQTSN